MRLTPDSYKIIAEIIEGEINDPTCFAHGPSQPDIAGQPPRRPPGGLTGIPKSTGPVGIPQREEESARRFAHQAAEQEQKRIALTDEETALFEAYLYENFRRQYSGERALAHPEFWHAKNDALNRKRRGLPPLPAAERKFEPAKTSETSSPEPSRPHVGGVTPNVSGPPESGKASTSPTTPAISRPANADGINPDDYTAATQETIRILGTDLKNVSTDAISRLRAAGQVIDQPTGAVLGQGTNALGVEAFVRLQRKDGGVDTARFRFVWPWFSPAHWELVQLKRGTTPEQEAAKLAAPQKIRHADVLRVRGAINRLQAGMFAIVGGVSGIVEGAPLLGTLEAAAGVEQAGLAGADLTTGKEHRAWSARAVQAALEAAGVDTETARFLAEQGGLLVALGRATVDAAGTAHAVIETSTGYRIRLEFNPATLSTNGLGGAKIKVTRIAPDGTEIKPIGGRYPINSKYAGKVMPAEALPANLRAKYPNGIPFTSQGYPDFSTYAIKTVKPKGLTGTDIGRDKRAANREAGLSEAPEGYTWHHHEDGVTMQLVPTDLHDAVRHTGGSAVIRHDGK